MALGKAHMNRQLQELIEETRDFERRRERLEIMQEQMALDLMHDSSTGNPILDFALLTTVGVYDEAVLAQYKYLQKKIHEQQGTRMILAVQRSDYWEEDNLVILRNVYLAITRNADIRFDNERMILAVPVEPEYLAYKQGIEEGRLVNKWEISNVPWIFGGPLHTEYSSFQNSKRDRFGVFVTPLDAPCDIHLHPWDMHSLSREYGIIQSELDEFRRNWMTLKNEKKEKVKIRIEER